MLHHYQLQLTSRARAFRDIEREEVKRRQIVRTHKLIRGR